MIDGWPDDLDFVGVNNVGDADGDVRQAAAERDEVAVTEIAGDLHFIGGGDSAGDVRQDGDGGCGGRIMEIG